jgi:hypothetical protein
MSRINCSISVGVTASSVADEILSQWLLQPLQGLNLFFSSVIIFIQTVGLLGKAISPSQGRDLHTGQ